MMLFMLYHPCVCPSKDSKQGPVKMSVGFILSHKRHQNKWNKRDGKF